MAQKIVEQVTDFFPVICNFISQGTRRLDSNPLSQVGEARFLPLLHNHMYM
jgi:hypothetical protein